MDKKFFSFFSLSIIAHGFFLSLVWFYKPNYYPLGYFDTTAIPFEIIEVQPFLSEATHVKSRKNSTIRSMPSVKASDSTLFSASAPETQSQKINAGESKKSYLNAAVAPSSNSNMAQAGSLIPHEVTPISSLTRLPRIIKEVRASYPSEALEKRVSGTVVVDLILNESGRVTDVTLVEGLGYGLDEAAIEALSNFQFSPGYVEQTAVPVKIRYRYRFEINR